MRLSCVIIACLLILPSQGVAQSHEGSTSGGEARSATQDAADSRSEVPAKARRDADRLIRTMKTAPQARVRAQAALALRVFPDDPAVADALVAALRDSHVMVRTSAARALTEVAAADKFTEICEIGQDESEPFALTWIRKAAAAAAGGAEDIRVSVDGLAVVEGYSLTEATQQLQSGVLKFLLDNGGYSISSSFDFTERGAWDDSTAISLRFGGRARTSGGASSAGAVLEIRAIAPNGFVVWESTVDVRNVGRGGNRRAADRFDDQYTIRDVGEDARLMAAFEAGRKAGAMLEADLRGAVDSDGEAGSMND